MVPESHVAHLDRWVDQHIKQINPVNLALGFSYVLTRTASGNLVPIF
jgi:hypothetical protein